MIRTRIFHYLFCGFACLAIAASASAIEVDANMRKLLGKDVASAGGAIASFDYNQTTDAFYVAVYGSDAGLRTITNDGSGWIGDSATTNIDYDGGNSTILRFMRSTDVVGGVTSTDNTGKSFVGGILLNPTELTIDVPVADANGYPIPDGSGGYQTTPVTYPAGTLAYIMDQPSTVVADDIERPDCSKLMWRWDLRGVDDVATALPDLATAQAGILVNDEPWVWGSVGTVDWNDMLSVVCTKADLYAAATAGGATLPKGGTTMYQPAWSTDGQALYFVEKTTAQGGIYKVDARTGDMEWIYRENQDSHIDLDPDDGINTTGAGIMSEPSVVSTATLDFSGGQYSGDQIVFGGTKANGNYGGLNYITTNASGTSDSQVLLDASEFRAWAENDSLAITYTTAADDQGNVYFYSDATDSVTGLKSGGVFMRDTEGRLASVMNLAEYYELNYSIDGERYNVGGFYRLKTYEDADGVHLLYRGDNAYIGEIDVNTVGDLTGDDVVDSADCGFMIEQYKKSCYNAIPTVPVDGQEVFLDYLLADMNGSAVPTSKGTGTLDNVAVTFADVETLAQFVTGGLLVGDLNWDGVAADVADWTIFDANFGLTPESGVWSWFDGDLNFDGVIDATDRAMMSPDVPGDANRDGKVDGSDVTILAGNWQALTNATWDMGDFNGDGKVDGSDVTILAGNWQAGVSTAASAVPEPSTIVLLLLGLATLAIKRVKK